MQKLLEKSHSKVVGFEFNLLSLSRRSRSSGVKSSSLIFDCCSRPGIRFLSLRLPCSSFPGSVLIRLCKFRGKNSGFMFIYTKCKKARILTGKTPLALTFIQSTIAVRLVFSEYSLTHKILNYFGALEHNN